MTTHLTTVTIPDADAAKAHLLAVGTMGPSLHPHVGSSDPWKVWNGWNYTRAVGQDANGAALMLEASHYASGGVGWTSIPRALLSPDHRQAWKDIAFPLEMLPAVAVVMHPEHTPEA